MSEQLPIHLEDRFKEAWGLFMKSPEVFVTISFGLLAATVLINSLPVVGQLASLAIAALGPAAFFLAADEASRTGTATFDSLKALPALFPQLLALLLVKLMLIGIGSLLVFPGIYLAVLLCFSELFVVIEGKTFVEALRASRNLVRGSWFRVFGFCIVVGTVALSGMLLVGLGLLFTLPFSAVVFYCVFRRSHVQVIG